MTVTNLRLLLPLALLLSACPLAAQQAYKGQLHVSDERFSVQGQLLHVYMKVSYDDTVVSTGETLLFTPVLKTSGHYTRLTTVAINGDARERYESRTDRLTQRRRINVPAVTRDSRKGTRYFVYDTTVPWQEWMGGASLYALCEESTWQGRDPHSYEDLLLRRLPLGRGTLTGTASPSAGLSASYGSRAGGPAVSGLSSLLTGGQLRPDWVQFLIPSYDAATASGVVTGTLSLAYGQRLSRRQCNQIADTLAQRVGEATANSGLRLLSMELTGYGAPIGNRQKNERWAAEQTLLLRQTLTGRRLTGQGDLRLEWVAEDWDSIRQLAAAASMPLRAATIDIIRSIDVTQGREEALRSLGSGSSYDYLVREVFPRVCRLTYRLRLAPAVPSSDVTWRDVPATITPANFYATALNYPVGSDMFCDVIDLAGRLFPECAEAQIDAAGVALLKGDTQRARSYLTAWLTDPRAYHNTGLLYLMEGQADKAEVYLRMADAQGVVQSRDLLHLMGR